jgi:hypothetical protein
LVGHRPDRRLIGEVTSSNRRGVRQTRLAQPRVPSLGWMGCTGTRLRPCSELWQLRRPGVRREGTEGVRWPILTATLRRARGQSPSRDQIAADPHAVGVECLRSPSLRRSHATRTTRTITRSPKHAWVWRGRGRRKRSSAPCATADSLRSWNYDPAGGAQSLTWYKGAQIVAARNICRAFASTAEACPIPRMSAS